MLLQAGFDFGDGTKQILLPGSLTPAIVYIDSDTNMGSGNEGLFAFRVDRIREQKSALNTTTTTTTTTTPPPVCKGKDLPCLDAITIK